MVQMQGHCHKKQDNLTALACLVLPQLVYLFDNWRIELNDILLCTNNKQPAMLPSLLIGHAA